METPITKETLEHLIELSKMELDEAREEKILLDLRRILEYFSELNNVSTDTIAPAVGGSFNKDIVRADESKDVFIEENLIGQFPKAHETLLCVPSVFEKNEDI